MFILYDGKLIKRDGLVVSPLDHSHLYGHGLFETMRAYHGKVFRLSEHLKRLEQSAAFLGWPKIPGFEGVEKGIATLLEANNHYDASVRLTVSRGIGAPRPDAASCGAPIITILTSPLPSPLPESGWMLRIASLKRNLSSPLVKIKSANYLDNILARSEAKATGAQEAIMLNTDGFVAEGTMSNIFLVKEGELITPDDDSGILPGITRKVVIELAGQAELAVSVRPVRLEELMSADELFLTSSVMEVIPANLCTNSLSSLTILDNPVTVRLKEMYRQLTEKECSTSGNL